MAKRQSTWNANLFPVLSLHSCPLSTLLTPEAHAITKNMLTFAYENEQNRYDMEATAQMPQTTQMIVTLESGAMASEIRKALKLIRGIASVRIATIADDRAITPAMRRSIHKARQESARGETIVCRTPEDMQKYFDSL